MGVASATQKSITARCVTGWLVWFVLPQMFLMFSMALVPTTLAQTGGLALRVIDAQSGGPLPGATVTISNSQGLVALAAQLTDERGRVSFPVLRAGSGYLIQVELAGYATIRLPDLRVATGHLEERVVQLSQALAESLTETVSVLDTTDLVDLDQVGSSSEFTDEFMTELPVKGRFYQNLLTLAPGVTDADGDGNPNVHGARTRDFKATVSGVSNVDPLTGQWLSFVNPDSIEVMDVITAGAGVEFGRAQGGFARIVQKQGTNDFEGVFSYVRRDSKWDRDGASSGTPEALIPDFSWSQPSAQLSGPIVKDRLWFRFSHEWIDREDPVDTFTSIVPSRTKQRIFADQITWQVSPRNKLAFQYQYDPLELTAQDLSSTVPLQSTRNLESGGPTYAITWTAPFSPRLLGQMNVAYQDHFQNVSPTTEGVRNRCASWGFFSPFSLFDNSFCHRSTIGVTSGSYPETSKDKRQRLTVQGQATWYLGRRFGAEHRIKFGFISENERYARDLERRPEILDIDTFELAGNFSFCNDCRVPKATVTTRVPVPGQSTGRTWGTSWGMYIEDQIKPTSSLSLTIGLRVDREEIDAEGFEPFDPEVEIEEFTRLAGFGAPIGAALARSFTAYPDIPGFHHALAETFNADLSAIPLGPAAVASTFWKPQRLADVAIGNTNVSPRLSLAWDPWRNGKTKLAFSAGRYYDKIFLAVPLIELEPVSTKLTFDGNGHGIVSIQGLLETISPTVSASFVSRDLRTPYQDEWTLRAEHSPWPETVLSLAYIHRDFEDQLQDVDINHATGDFGRCLVANEFGDPVVTASDGSGFMLTDLITGEVYEDTDPGPGDGVIDDCTGNVEVIAEDRFGFDLKRKPAPDGLADLYVQNPGWSEILLLGNFNRARYEAFVFEVVRRMYRSWEMQASYTWSEARGNAEDFSQALGNERNLVEDESGFLSYDQRHVAQINAVSITPWWGVRTGMRLRWESGLPYSELEPRLTVFAGPPQLLNIARDRDVRFRLRYPTGQRNDQRNPSFWTVDISMAKEVEFPGRVNLRLSAEVFNIFNDDTATLERRVRQLNTGTRRFGRRYQLAARLSF